MENPQATLVTMVTLLITFTLVAVVTMVTWGIHNYPDNSDVTGAIRKDQRPNSDERATCVHFLTCY
jgi:hypothetical protein